MRLRILSATIAGLALLAAAPSALAARYSPRAIWGPTTYNGESAFPIYHDLGVSIYEAPLHWSTVAPSRPHNPRNPGDPAYKWPADLDIAMQQASLYHVRVLLQVIGTPAWATGARAWNYPPSNSRDLANYMTAAARRYPSVHLWMVWGEPDRRPNFAVDKRAQWNQRKLTRAQAGAPHVYAEMLDASYGALKAVSKQNLVIGGDTYTTGDIPVRLWIDNLRLPNGQPPRMDMYGHNPFCWRDPNLRNPQSPFGNYDFSDLARLSRLVNQELARPGHTIKLFLSEWGVPTAPGDEFGFYVSLATQAKWTTDAWRIVRRSSFIYALGWIGTFDDPQHGITKGLLTQQGVPKPGYFAFKYG